MVGLAILLSALLSPQDPGPGISRELAAQRKQQLTVVEYDVQLAIEPGSSEVSGEIWVRFQLATDAEPAAPVWLDFAGSGLSDVTVNDRPCDAPVQQGHVGVPREQLGKGWNDFRARFRSPVGATGTPLTVYREPQDGSEYWYTLVVPADCHRLFPCFDQPDLRAVLQLELDLPAAWQAVSNGKVLTTTPSGAGRRKWSFAPTKPLPTYLLAFACGPFAVAEAPIAAPGLDPEQPLRLLYRRSEAERMELELLTGMHARGLAWLADRFQTPYAFDKLDLVLLPGFPYGGMEHAGAIFYRESALVFDHPPNDAELVRRSALIYHELAHQWFGNLVTMKWFDDLWLKEGFATFIAYQAIDELEPERKSWLRFLQRVKPRAYEVDATPGTTPIYQELRNLADAKSAYGAIVYNKAPAVLRALHEQLGAKRFFAGLRMYLARHAFSNADWQDLAAALQDASKDDLRAWSQSWLLTASMPRVRLALANGADGKVSRAELTQQAVHGARVWPIDVELLVIPQAGERRTLRVTGAQARIAVPDLVGSLNPLAVIANPRDVAYGQFLPDPASRLWLLDHLADEPDALLRAVGATALFDAVREAELAPAAFAAFCLTLLARETDPDCHAWLLDALGTCGLRYLTTPASDLVLQQASTLLLEQLHDGHDSGRELAIFRFLARTSRAAAVLDLCQEVAVGTCQVAGLQPGKQDRFLAAAAVLANGAPGFQLAKVEQQFAGQDIAKELFLARAAVANAATKQAYWQQYCQLRDPPEQWSQDSLAFFHWPGQEPLTLPYLRLALEQVNWVKQNRRIFYMPAWLDGFINAHSSPEALRIVDDFLGSSQLDSDVRNKLLQSRDGLSRAVRIRAAFAK